MFKRKIEASNDSEEESGYNMGTLKTLDKITKISKRRSSKNSESDSNSESDEMRKSKKPCILTKDLLDTSRNPSKVLSSEKSSSSSRSSSSNSSSSSSNSSSSSSSSDSSSDSTSDSSSDEDSDTNQVLDKPAENVSSFNPIKLEPVTSDESDLKESQFNPSPSPFIDNTEIRNYETSFLSVSGSSSDDDSDTDQKVLDKAAVNLPFVVSSNLQPEVNSNISSFKTPPPVAFTSNNMINDDSTSSSSASSHMFPPTTQPEGEPLESYQLKEFPEEHFDPNERSKDRKKNLEVNKSYEKRTNAMSLLKIKREVKQKLEEEEAKRKAQKKVDDEKEELDGVTSSRIYKKLKSAEVYSDDSSERDERSSNDQKSRSSSHFSSGSSSYSGTSINMINDDSTSSSSASSHMLSPTPQPDGEPLKSDQLKEFPEEHFDPKERSKDRKKNLEVNKTYDKRTNAMSLLKIKREVKQKREEEEAKRKAQKKVDDEKEDLDGFTSSRIYKKLKSAEVYSDDSSNYSERDERSSNDQKSRSSSHSSSRSSSYSGNYKRFQSTSQSSHKKPTFISTVDEMNKLRISRFKLEKFINLPTFEKTVVGCFVRISLGNNNPSQKLVYRVAEIIAVLETPHVYLFGNSRTNKGVRLRHGTQERVFRLEFVSNQDITVSEFDKWKEACHQYSVDLPRIDLIEQKKKDIQLAMGYEFREEDITNILKEKDRFRAHPTNCAMKKINLMKERDDAQMRGEVDLAKKFTSQIQELDEHANDLDKLRTSSISSISCINNRNRKKNVEEAEKAIIEEAKTNKGEKISDPFTRRLTKPKMAIRAFREPPEAPKIHIPKEKKEEEHTSADKIFSLHDFDIDCSVDLENVPALSKPIEKKTIAQPTKRILNLEEYKKRRGLI